MSSYSYENTCQKLWFVTFLERHFFEIHWTISWPFWLRLIKSGREQPDKALKCFVYINYQEILLTKFRVCIWFFLIPKMVFSHNCAKSYVCFKISNKFQLPSFKLIYWISRAGMLKKSKCNLEIHKGEWRGCSWMVMYIFTLWPEIH